MRQPHLQPLALQQPQLRPFVAGHRPGRPEAGIGGVDLARVTDAVVRVTVASLFLGAVAFCSWYAVDGWLGRSTIAQVISLGFALALGALTYLGSCRLLRVRELDVLRETIARRAI